jgi:cysteinyl-tRNA synthetase
MNLDEFRYEMTAYRQHVRKEGKAFKEALYSVNRLTDLYRKFDAEERAMADQVLAEWLLSEDESVRFDAWVLIDDFKIRSALPALEKLAQRLAASPAVGAPDELERINRIIADLARCT